ncbi:MAG: methyltransferase domain-containing protein, partial [Natronosporangium sp.]
LDLRASGEECLASMEDASVDVVFTVSVLDHLPEPEPVFVELARIARTALILLEPFTGRVGRSDGEAGSADPHNVLTSIPFSYTWDYVALSRKLAGSWRWRWVPYPLSSGNMGPYYWLIEGTK